MRTLAFAVLLGFLPLMALADSWMPPTPSAHVSDNASIIVRIDPGTTDPSKKPSKPAHCRYFRYAEDKKIYEFWKEFDLVNPVLPSQVVVPDDGSYLATFDDYMGIGTSENTVVVYDGAGKVQKRWSLKDIFTEAEIDDLPHSTMSIHWCGEVGPMVEHQQEIYILPAQSPFDPKKKYKGFMLDVKTLKIRVDPRY